MKRLSRFIIPVLLLLSVSALSVPASDGHMKIGIRIGHFTPQDWLIQGPAETPGQPYSWQWYGGNMGFGGGIDFGLQAAYCFPRWELRFGLGARSLAKEAKLRGMIWETWDYDGRLQVYSIEMILMHRLADQNSSFVPYVGAGPGLYFADWEQKMTREMAPDLEPSVRKASSTPIGINFLVGLEYVLIGNIILNCEMGYEYAESDWELEISDSDRNSELRDLNIGGTSLRLGLGYEF
jgi:opacity protein-like surface antigen